MDSSVFYKRRENLITRVLIFVLKLKDKLSLKDCDEFFLQLKLLKLCCIFRPFTKCRKIISKLVLLWYIIVNLFFFYGLLNYILRDSCDFFRLLENAGPMTGIICMTTNSLILLFHSEEFFDLIDTICKINQKCEQKL